MVNHHFNFQVSKMLSNWIAVIPFIGNKPQLNAKADKKRAVLNWGAMPPASSKKMPTLRMPSTA
jgi:hypothetical protein